jgi:hypothetical protein
MTLDLDKLGLHQVIAGKLIGSTHTYLSISSKDVLYDKASRTFYTHTRGVHVPNHIKPGATAAPPCIVVSGTTESWLFAYHHTAISHTSYIRNLDGHKPYYMQVYEDETFYMQEWNLCRSHSSSNKME